MPGSLPRLTGAALIHPDLTRACLTRALLSGARLNRARLNGADLMAADLTHEVLDGAQLTGAVLTGPDLLIDEAGAATASVITYVMPVGAVLLGVGLLGEKLTIAAIVGLAYDRGRCLAGGRAPGARHRRLARPPRLRYVTWLSRAQGEREPFPGRNRAMFRGAADSS